MRTVNFEIHDETSAVRLSAEWDDLAQEVGRRVATRPTRGSRERRLDDKRQRSERKAARRPPRLDE